MNVKYDILSNKIKLENKIFAIISGSDYTNKRALNADKIIGELKIDKLLDYYEKVVWDGESYSININEIIGLITSYYTGLLKGLKFAFNNEIIDNVTILYPFFRISNITKTYVITYFTYVNYFNKKKEFWITEAIPEIPEVYESEETLYEYIDNLLYSIRNSFFINSTTYKYLPKEELSDDFDEKTVIIYNYKLFLFISENFGINIKELNRKISISSLGKLELNINKKNKERDVFIDNEILSIAIKNYKLNSYCDYIERTAKNMYYFEVVKTMYDIFLKYLKKKKLYEIDEVRKNIIGKFLYDVTIKEKINFSKDIDILIRKEKEYSKNDLLGLIAMMIGSTYGGYKNTQN